MGKTLALCFYLLGAAPSYASSAVGFYSNGSLKEGESIIDRQTPVHKLFLLRKKFFTTKEMNDVISNAADFVRQEFPSSEILQVGDLSAERGGSAPGHGSHQNGLDADLVYLTRNAKLQSPAATFWEEEFVKKNMVTANFHTERNLLLFKHLVASAPVGRIFVDLAVKKLLCQHAKNTGVINDPLTKETLRRLRVEALHTNHFHLRIKCPTGDTQCTSQSEVPTGTGCDELSLMLEAATPVAGGGC